jgi:hypothetical protein
MSDLSDFAAVQNIVGSVDRTLNVKELLLERHLAQRVSFNAKSAGSVPQSLEISTAKSSVRQASEDLFKFTPPSAKAPVIRKYRAEQEFEGTVVAINQQDDTFTARLADLTGSGADEEGEFSLSELNGDQSLVVPGAIFTWTIGLQTRGPTRQQVRQSDIRFRRLPAVSQQAIAKAEAEAQELSQFLRETDSAEPLTARL